MLTRSMINKRNRKRINYNETLTRPSWDDDVKASIYEDARVGDKYKCAITKKLYEKSEMSIDHIIPWEKYCRTNADVDDKVSMFKAYNDKDNLRLVSKSANSRKGNRGNALR
jgi:hypothetical protein